VFICKDGEWKEIIVDDWLPVKNGEPIFSRANGPELWVLILEKVWAKLHGSYHAIESGLAVTAFRDLTGAPGKLYTIAKEEKL
jgi:calpain-15